MTASPKVNTGPRTVPPAGSYAVDVEGSSITLRTRHLFGLAPVRARIAVRRGRVEVADPVADSGAHVEIDAASFDTGNPMRDARVRSATFLDAERHPTIVFAADHVVHTADSTVLPGTLTVREVTRPMRLDVESAVVDGDVLLTRATTRVDRVEFGLTASRGMTGRCMNIDLHRPARHPGERRPNSSKLRPNTGDGPRTADT